MDGKHIANSVWNGITGWVRQESAAATALVQAFIALGIAFSWWTWSNAQTGAVIGIVSALLGMFVRSQVTPLVRPRSSRNFPLTEAGPSWAPAGPSAAQAGPSAAQAGPSGARGGHAAGSPAMPQPAPTIPQAAPPGGPAGQPPATPPAREAGPPGGPARPQG